MRTYKVLPFSRDLGWCGVIAPCPLASTLLVEEEMGLISSIDPIPGCKKC